MSRILMRAPASPFVPSNHAQAIRKNEVNSNSGNLLFPYSISRALMTAGTEIDYVGFLPERDKETGEIDFAALRERYDCFIIPLANAFRSSFSSSLDKMSAFIERAEIPCIVIGVGLQANVGADGSRVYRFDDAVRRFMRAVLGKSACVGVRGATTGAYLERLGFAPERDFTVIGCPSLYLYGPELPRPRAAELSPSSSISLNCKVTLPKKIHRYLGKVARAIPDFHYVVQNTYELASLYYGLDIRQTNPKGAQLHVPKNYPTGRDDAAIRAGRVIGFTDVPSWLSYLQGKDLSFGTRIHGNIAGVLAGTPTFITAPDARVLELARYHRIPHMRLKDLERKTSIFDLLADVDFDAVLEGHAERFAHYLDFLHRNGLATVFDYGPPEGPVPFDERVAKVRPSGPLTMKRLITPLDKRRIRSLVNDRQADGTA